MAHRDQGGHRRWPAINVAAAAAGVALLAASCAPAGATDTPENAVLRLELDECFNALEHRATAFALGDGYAVTVAHAFEDIETFTVRTADQRELMAEIIYLDVDRDLSVMRLIGDDLPKGLALRTAGEDEEQASIVSFAEVEGPKTKDATLLRFVRLTLDGVGDRAGIEVAADIVSGDSGGPLLDSDGLVIGMVFATSRKGERGWAIAAPEIDAAFDARQDEPIALTCTPAD